MGFKGIDEWQVEIRKKNNDPYDVDELVLYVHTKETHKENIKKELYDILRNEMEISPEIIFLNKKICAYSHRSDEEKSKNDKNDFFHRIIRSKHENKRMKES